jgi:GMP synthase-like glutamine amidotransferase
VTPAPQPSAGRALVLQHHPDEHPGALASLLTAAGLTITTVELDEGERIPALGEFDMLIAMGGPMDVWQEAEHPWLVTEKAAIRHWVTELDRPYLGVCLGHQLLADALGGTVGPMAKPEIGVVEISLTPKGLYDGVFGHLPEVVHGLQWHGAAVERPPVGATVLAGNDHCAVQALRVGARAWGVQFHVEVEASTIPKWAQVPEYEDALARTGSSASSLEQAVKTHLESMARSARTLFQGIVGSLVGVTVPR